MSVYGSYINEGFDPGYAYILTEAYFGKNENFIEMENIIGEIRDNYNIWKDVNKSPVVIKFNRLMEKQFGMELFGLNIAKTNTINAWTCPVATRFDIAFSESISKKVSASKTDGYRFKKDNGLCIICTVTSGLLEKEEITNGEIMAILLHELGHNFADAIYAVIDSYNKNNTITYTILEIVSALLSAGKTYGGSIATTGAAIFLNTNVVKKAVEYSKQSKSENDFIGAVGGISAKLSNAGATMSGILSRLGFGLDIRFYKLLNWTSKVFKTQKTNVGRYNEVLADRFPGLYGYSAESVSALTKMSLSKSTAELAVDKIPIIGTFANNCYDNALMDIYDYDCHPHLIQRINANIKNMNEEIKGADIDPKIVSEIKKQIDEMEKIKNDLLTSSEGASKSEVAKTIFYNFVNSDDPDSIPEKVRKEINKLIDKKLKK